MFSYKADTEGNTLLLNWNPEYYKLTQHAQLLLQL